MRLPSGALGLPPVVALVLVLVLAQPTAASSLYHETCAAACNGAYAHCCAHVTGVIGELPCTVQEN